MYETKPWLRFYGSVPEKLDYPAVTLHRALARVAERTPGVIAWEFFDRRATYGELMAEIDRCAAGLAALGLKKGDRLLVSMPTSPQGVVAFYAANKLGAVSCFIHPLSTVPEIQAFLKTSRSRFALTLDAFYGKFAQAREGTALETLVLAKLPDYLGPLVSLGFWLKAGRKIKPVPPDPMVRWWRDVMAPSHPPVPAAPGSTDDLAVILFSGGTTGNPKGILLSNRNFIAEGMQVAAWGRVNERDSMLAILPIFHGFGLGVCVNAALMAGGRTLLVPQFTPQTVAKLIRRKRPTIVVGVPTLFDALGRDPSLRRTDLSCLRATFCGADTLPRPVKERFEALVRERGGRVQLLEGYGLTEAVTAIMATPLDHYREGSIGVPFPDMLAKVVLPGTQEEAPVGTEGEICISGPAVMLGYLERPEETAETLRTHADGRVWLHTGDIATMDADGWFYFKLRAKRMIKVSGMNVYPAQVEEVLHRHPDVKEACVIGVPDPSQIQVPKAFVVPNDWRKAGPDLERALVAHCQQSLIKWSCPREVEFRESLPRTLVGKVAFNQLEKEEAERRKAAG